MEEEKGRMEEEKGRMEEEKGRMEKEKGRMEVISGLRRDLEATQAKLERQFEASKEAEGTIQSFREEKRKLGQTNWELSEASKEAEGTINASGGKRGSWDRRTGTSLQPIEGFDLLSTSSTKIADANPPRQRKPSARKSKWSGRWKRSGKETGLWEPNMPRLSMHIHWRINYNKPTENANVDNLYDINQFSFLVTNSTSGNSHTPWSLSRSMRSWSRYRRFTIKVLVLDLLLLKPSISHILRGFQRNRYFANPSVPRVLSTAKISGS
ncbi:hypothetical protein MMC22_003914 [Lobaria immixta]|nr:hypothetical protein [Lobaria immixta]